MMCTFAGGTHLGTCRDRFIFGSCCRLPPVEDQTGESEIPSFAAVVIEDEESDWEDRVNGGKTEDVCGRRWEDTQEGQEAENFGNTRIQGGQVANRTSWPWQAGLRKKFGPDTSTTPHHCGAVLLNHHWVATAAHCIYKKNMTKFVVLLGDYNNKNDDIDDGQIMRDIKQVLIHPAYRHQNYDNDLALLRLESPVVYSKYILPICLPPTKMKITGKKGFVTGWGRIYEGGPEPSLLNVVDVPILSNSECNNMFKLASLDEHVSDDIWVCAGYRDGGKDACDGDSGGPLSIQDVEKKTGENVWILGGIISWGPNSCGEKFRPGVYTRIPSYSEWIHEKIRVHTYEWSKTTSVSLKNN